MEVQDEATDSRIQRIGEQTRGLVDDIKSWVELRMELSQIEVEDRVEEKVNEATAGAIVGIVAGLAVVFLLIAAAIGLGSLFGHQALGFLAVGVILLVLTGIVHAARPKFVRIGKERPRE